MINNFMKIINLMTYDDVQELLKGSDDAPTTSDYDEFAGLEAPSDIPSSDDNKLNMESGCGSDCDCDECFITNLLNGDSN